MEEKELEEWVGRINEVVEALYKWDDLAGKLLTAPLGQGQDAPDLAMEGIEGMLYFVFETVRAMQKSHDVREFIAYVLEAVAQIIQ